ncbi:MFS transporter [Nocardioides panacisoli]|uniref:MFS transporter n=1 Tax=Nocardioides panacisoli TaxID=627624 RepID=UPI001C627765|nr:MFS transporter [Nocardioides panacisoli]QYJ05703.1 MFS transporter [Nocardioides panacisoli]
MTRPDSPAQRPLVAVAVLCTGGLAASMMQTVVMPIQSDLPDLLGTSASSAGWVVTITLLAGAVGMPVSGRLADMFGKQRVFVTNVAVLVVGSIVCALASSLWPMLVGRGLQGLAMGLVPVGISLMREVTPPHLASTAIAAMSGTMGVGGAIGLPMSAAITQYGDWHAIFWVSGAVGLGALLLAVLFVPHVADAHGGRIDTVGVIGMALGLVALLVGISKSSTWGWIDLRTLGFVALGLVVLGAWAAFELRVRDPLVDLRTSVRRPVLMTNLAAVAIGFGLMSNLVVIPQLLQLDPATGFGVGASLLETGLWLAPAGLMMMLFSPVSGRIIDRLGARAALLIGGSVVAAGYLLGLALMQDAWQLALAACVIAAGVGIAYAAMPTLIMDAVPPREAGAAVGLNALMRAMGTTLSAAVMATVLTSSTVPFGGTSVPSETAFAWCFGLGAVAALVGVAVTLLVPRRTPSAVEPVAVTAGS